ncbi:MAG TPA: ABC transporter ATP-binding protein [Terriglobales bacterium]|nr:ABC transporter ATP-binding protein [Terriglobales bacterium]
MPAVETFALEKTYRVGFWRSSPKVALKSLTMSVEAGEIFGYLGPNGAGKTTTIRLLMGLVNPTGGSVKILGGSIDDPAIRAQIGFLPEQPYFYDHLTAKELLNYYAALSSVPAKERSRRIDATLTRVGLAQDAWNTQLRKFSKGMLQRVGLAQAVLHEPKLVVLDEPMSGLDPTGRREVRDLIEELNHEGKTVLFSTHILSDAEALCDRVAVIGKGELRGIGVVADLTASVKGNVEIMWQGASAVPAISSMGLHPHAVGDTVRVVVAEAKVDAVIDALRRSNAKLVAVTPVRTTLEDYFLAQLAKPTAEVSR